MDNIKKLFQGNMKWFTFAGLAVVLFFVFRSRSGRSGGNAPAFSSMDTPIGSAAPGVTSSDLQSALDDQAKMQQEYTTNIMSEMYEGFSDALNIQSERFASMTENIADSFDTTLQSLRGEMQAQEDRFINEMKAQDDRFTGLFESTTDQFSAVFDRIDS